MFSARMADVQIFVDVVYKSYERPEMGILNKPFLKIQQSNTISILDTVELVRARAQLISDVCRKANSKLNETRFLAFRLNLP